MMNQSNTDHLHTLPPPMTNYIPSSVPPIHTLNPQQQQQYQQQPLAAPEQPPVAQNPQAAHSSSDTEVSPANFNLQQQQMAAMLQMQQQQQQWAAAGYTAPYMMPYPQQMMMMQPQMPMDRPASRQSSRPSSRQSVNAPVSSSRSLVNGQAGGQTQAPILPPGMVPNQGYPGYASPGMYNPWFDPYWQSMYASYQHPYSFGYNDEMMKYWKQVSQGGDDDRYSHHSAAHSQSKQSQHSSSMHTWGSTDSLNDPYYQNHNAMVNGYYPPKQQAMFNQPKRPTKPMTDPNTLLTTTPISNQQIPSTESKPKPKTVPQNGEEEEEEESDDDDDDEDEDEDEDEEESDDTSSDRFSIKSDLAQINEDSAKARRTPLLYIRPHLRAKFAFDQLIQVLPQSPSDTNQPATVEILSANSLHSLAPALVEERQLMSDFIGPLTTSTAKSNVIRYCERQSQLANKSLHIIDRDALSILWQYMALLVKTNGVIDVRVDIPKILWSSSNTPIIDESSTNSNHASSSSSLSTTTTLENSLREFLALGEIDTSIKFACENQLYTHALIISYLTDKQFFEKTIQNIISNLDNGDVLKTFYELGAGLTPSVVTNVTKAHYGDWKRHLAVILANRTDVNAQFVDLCVKTMGDSLVASGRVYAGHFCYLIGNSPLGSYRNNADKIAVIGCIHAGQSNLSFATIPNLQLTEVYEYALRRSLTTFIPLKIYYTSKLIHHGLKREALVYCEEIANTLIKQGNTAYVQLIDLQLFILIAEKSRAFNRNFQLDPISYKEPTWLIELKKIIQNLTESAFLNKTVRDQSFNTSQLQPQAQINQTTYISAQIPHVNQQAEQTVTTIPPTTVSYPPTTTSYPPSAMAYPPTNIPNGYDPSNQLSSEQSPYANSTATNYQNMLKVDTNVHYQTQVPSNYYQAPQQQLPTPAQPYYAPDTQQWPQQPTQTDLLNNSSQLPSTNNSYHQPPSEQSSYIQPGFTSTPNSHASQQPQQTWHPSGQNEQRDRLPSTEQQQQQMESMRRRSSIITFDQTGIIQPSNWQQTSIVDSRKMSSTSTQSNASSNSPKNNTDQANFAYQPPQLMRYSTNQTSSISEEPQPSTNGPTKKKHPMFDDDDVFPNNSQKSTDTKTNGNAAANSKAAGTPKVSFVENIITRIGWKKATQAHLPDDKNKALKYDEKTGRWIDTAKSADEQASTQVKPPPMVAASNPLSSSVNNPPQPSAATSFNPSMPPGSSQPRTMNFTAGSTTTITNAAAPQTIAPTYQTQANTNITPITTQSQTQPQQQQKVPAQLSAAQQRLQDIRQKQQQQQQASMQQTQAPPAASSNQYSLRSRPNQSRYVDVLASTKGAVAPAPNVSLNDLMPTPSSGMPTYAVSNQANNYFVPGNVQSTTDGHEQPSS